jgi:hypothetical protein
MPIVDTRAFGETVKLGRFIIRFSFFALFALFDREKNKKRYSTDDTVADENQFKISRQTRCVFCRSLSSWSLFSSLVARVSMVCCASSFYISLEKEELFYSDDYSRAKSARDDAARSASFFEC